METPRRIRLPSTFRLVFSKSGTVPNHWHRPPQVWRKLRYRYRFRVPGQFAINIGHALLRFD
ncbi:MAG: hypothetical protein Q8Q59_13165 [Luteolibacter sp.]|jgi:hypothetical protein|nr:hypothetical protein [Luteolibacter sp.]